MVEQGDIDSLYARIAFLERAVVQTQGSQCTAEMPHDELVYQRGPNIYRCRCGMVYRKALGGALAEVT